MPTLANPEEVLVAFLTDVRHVATMLRSVACSPRAIIEVSAAGLLVVAEEARVLLGKAYIPLTVFETYAFNPPSDIHSDTDLVEEDDGYQFLDDRVKMSFSINLFDLLEALNMFGTAGASSTGSGGGERAGKKRKWTDGGGDDEEDGEDSRRYPDGGANEARNPAKISAARLSWPGEGEPLRLEMIPEGEDKTRMISLFNTSKPEPFLDFEPAQDDAPALRIILQSMWLLNAFQSLDPSTDRVRISSIIPEQPPASYLSSVSGGRKKPAKFNEGVDFRIEADNTWGGVQMNFKHTKAISIIFERTASVSHAYRRTFLHRLIRALGSSNKVSVQLFSTGLIMFQCMISLQHREREDVRLIRNEEEREKKRSHQEAKKRGDINDGIVEFSMMSLEDDLDDED